MSKKSYFIFFAFIMFFTGLIYASSTSSILPTGDGFYTQWTPSTGTSHSSLVDETLCNGTADYNFTTTVGNRDSYSFSLSQVADGSKITQIDIKPCASRNTTGGASPVMNVFYRINGVNSSDSGSYSLSGVTPTELATTTFSGLNIFKTSTTTLEIGSVLTSSTKGVRLSRISAILTYTLLNAPTSLAIGTSTSSQVSLSWSDNSTIEDGFVIERKNDTASTTFATIATTTANITTFNDAGVSASTTYSYRVKAFNFGGQSSYTNTSSTTTLPNIPNSPSGLSSIPVSSSKINLSWTDNSLDETAFVIERKNDTASTTFATIATTSANTISFSNSTGLSSSTSYTYRVRAHNIAGYSDYSNTTSTTTLPAIPTAPSLLNSVSTSSTEIDLTWSDNSIAEDGFVIERKNDTASTTFATIATTTANITSYNDLGLNSATTYSYRLRSYNISGYSIYSNTSSTTTP